MESRFGHDFSAVRIHTDARAADSARAVGALAYTVGNDIVFGAGRYAPHSPAGRHLLAHELTHTLQSVAAGFSPPEADETGRLKPAATLRRQTEVSQPGDPAEAEADRTADQVTSGLIVDDDAQPGAGQMRKSNFLDEVQQASCAAADAELARAGRSTEGCPYIERAFGRYRTMPAAQVETMARRYADPAGVSTARDYIPRVSQRVAQGVARWAMTGDMSDVPAELMEDGAGGGGVMGMLGRLLFKRAADGTATPAETSMAATHLGRGEPIDGAARGRMEGAFRFDFSTVRIHDDARAAAASASLGARAFTIGSDVAFGPGEYRPGTPAGDALLAHELAHVVQQRGGAQSGSSALDEDADRSAVGAVMNIWTGAKHVAADAVPRLRTGLRLQRCGGSQRPAAGAPAGAACAAIDAAQWRTSVTNARAVTDTGQRAAAMTALVQQALCSLNMHVVEAGTAHPDTLVVGDYQTLPAINFDVNLNRKQKVTGGDLSTNAGYSIDTRNISILGPLSLNEDTPLTTQQFAEHELGVVRHGREHPGAANNDLVELETWTEDFRRYFHRYLTLPLEQRPNWGKLFEYYQRAPGGRQDALAQLVDYFNHPPAGADADQVRRQFRRLVRRRAGTQLATDLEAALPAPAAGP